MDLRRPIAALVTALALFGGGATTLTACNAAGQNQKDGSTDGESVNTETNEEADESQGNVPDLSDPQDGAEQGEGVEEDDG